MTDEQIINALEHNASKCKFYEDGHDGGLFESTLDLIKRYKSENERLKKNIDGLNIFTTNHTKVIRLQAIKEFAENLKEEMRLDDDCKYDCAQCHYDCKDYIPFIDNLVKEMTEENENGRNVLK